MGAPGLSIWLIMLIRAKWTVSNPAPHWKLFSEDVSLGYSVSKQWQTFIYCYKYQCSQQQWGQKNSPIYKTSPGLVDYPLRLVSPHSNFSSFIQFFPSLLQCLLLLRLLLNYHSRFVFFFCSAQLKPSLHCICEILCMSNRWIRSLLFKNYGVEKKLGRPPSPHVLILTFDICPIDSQGKFFLYILHPG